ncbi:sorting nexin-22 isoform X3 [Hypomesus transpacificus]|uniref:sorting nexin-22 isoform X3 n=1 Tax=Hypomesus transpacificus TaxID=137520 RepID=UPI001F081747|nr:sorting nexin-22 isoform X3 [Hypomesus transpacificus]
MIGILIPSLEKEVDESGKLRKLRKIVPTPDFPSKRHPHLRTKPLEQRRQELEDYIQEIFYQNDEVPQILLDFLDIKHFHSGSKLSLSLESLDNMGPQSYSCQLQHQVLGYCKDPYLKVSSSGMAASKRIPNSIQKMHFIFPNLCSPLTDLPDIVADGVLQGLYHRNTRVTFTASPSPAQP